jgi:hypothetical protein
MNAKRKEPKMSKTKSKTAHAKKIDSIEQTVEKSKIREDIVSQEMQAVNFYAGTKNPITEIHGATLPAAEAFFENLVDHVFKTFSSHKPKISFDCADMTRGVALKALLNLPENCHILNGQFSDLFEQDLIRKNGVLYATGESDYYNMYDFVWADYCCPIKTQLVKDFINVIENNVDKGLVYATFCGSTRAKGGRKTMLKDIIGNSKLEATPENIANALIETIKKNTTKNIKLIYNVIYGGGEKGITTMITIGFSVGMAKGAVEPIEENRQTRNHARYAVYYKMKHTKGWNVPVRKAQKKRKNAKSKAEAIKLEKEKVALRKKISIRLARGLNSEEIAEELNKKYGYDLTTGQIGSMKAWMNKDGKLAAKRVTA